MKNNKMENVNYAKRGLRVFWLPVNQAYCVLFGDQITSIGLDQKRFFSKKELISQLKDCNLKVNWKTRDIILA